MNRQFRIAALHLALAAILMRAFLPVGWMPNAASSAGSFFTICTMDGAVQQADPSKHGKGVPGDNKHSHDECPFAAAPHFAAPAKIAQLLPPTYLTDFGHHIEQLSALVPLAAFTPHSPRAPPAAV